MGQMPESYSVLIIPKEKSSAKGFSVSRPMLMLSGVVLSVLTLSFLYLVYDYINIERNNAELYRMQRLAKEQQTLIDGLIVKVNGFSTRLQELKQFDRKIRIMANIEKGKERDQLLGQGGAMREERRVSDQLQADQKELLSGMHRDVDLLAEEAKLREDSLAEIVEFFKEQQSIWASTPSRWPVTGWVTSEFGHRISPFTGAREFHAGLDIATRLGREIMAPADGIVVETGYRTDLGNYVKVDHGRGLSTMYGHLLKIKIKEGGPVKRGRIIGMVGNSGQSTGPHLHYTVFVKGVAVNPRKYLN